MTNERGSETGEDELPPMLLVEAALFSAAKPISTEEISDTTGLDLALIRLYIKKLSSAYGRRDTSLEVIKAGKKFTLRLKERYVHRVTELADPEIPRKVLKTAALIAYHQPVKQSDLVEMYGSKVYDHVGELQTLGLIRSRKDGSTKVLTTTQKFAESFGIDSISRKKIKRFIKDRALFSNVERRNLEDFGEEGDPAYDESEDSSTTRRSVGSDHDESGEEEKGPDGAKEEDAPKVLDDGN